MATAFAQPLVQSISSGTAGERVVGHVRWHLPHEAAPGIAATTPGEGEGRRSLSAQFALALIVATTHVAHRRRRCRRLAVVCRAAATGTSTANARTRKENLGQAKMSIGAPTIGETEAIDVSSFVAKGKKVEVRAPSKMWREAIVEKVIKGAAIVHYIGYDHQFDEQIPLKAGRLRPYGELHAQNLVTAKASYVHATATGCCSGCGAKLQCTSPMSLGYIPPDKFQVEDEDLKSKVLRPEEEVALLLKEEGAQELQNEVFPTRAKQTTYRIIANVTLDIRKEPDIDSELVEGQSLSFGDTFDVSEVHRSPDTRTYFRLADGRGWVFDWAMIRNVRTFLVEPLKDGLELIKEKKNSYQKVCQRCWSLWHYNDCDEILRPAYGTPAMDELTAEKFEEMLTSTLEPVTEACVLAVVDVFDFGPSFQMLEYLAKQVKGKKGIRVRIVANKLDLLPPDVHLPRLQGWISREAQRAGLERVRVTDVHPVSCHHGVGIKPLGRLLEQVDVPNDFYVVGAANAGKSSLLNRLAFRKRKGVGQIAANAQDGFVVSVMPGTTIKPMVIKYQQGRRRIIDTPGLLVPGTLHEKISINELKRVVPQTKGAFRVTFHMDEGRTILMGGFARIDFIEGRPFQFTVFAAEKVKLHRCKAPKAQDYAERFVGKHLTPPFSRERFDELQPFETHRFELEGTGWDEACADIVFHGLGWISVTGCGKCVVEAKAPKGVAVTVREALMPHEAKWTGVKYKGHPGWYHVRTQITRGHGVGKVRQKLKKVKF